MRRPSLSLAARPDGDLLPPVDGVRSNSGTLSVETARIDSCVINMPPITLRSHLVPRACGFVAAASTEGRDCLSKAGTTLKSTRKAFLASLGAVFVTAGAAFAHHRDGHGGGGGGGRGRGKKKI